MDQSNSPFLILNDKEFYEIDYGYQVPLDLFNNLNNEPSIES